MTNQIICTAFFTLIMSMLVPSFIYKVSNKNYMFFDSISLASLIVIFVGMILKVWGVGV